MNKQISLHPGILLCEVEEKSGLFENKGHLSRAESIQSTIIQSQEAVIPSGNLLFVCDGSTIIPGDPGAAKPAQIAEVYQRSRAQSAPEKLRSMLGDQYVVGSVLNLSAASILLDALVVQQRYLPESRNPYLASVPYQVRRKMNTREERSWCYMPYIFSST